MNRPAPFVSFDSRRSLRTNGSKSGGPYVVTERPEGCLVLADGSVFRGQRIGHLDTAWGEVVFNTSMTGYQEMLTDPSYAGQILVLTYPLIGNYGVTPVIAESAQIQVRGLVVRSDCATPSHPLGGITVDEYLRSGAVPGLAGVDTRAITRRIRDQGVMQGLIVDPDEVEGAKGRLAELPVYESQDFIGVGDGVGVRVGRESGRGRRHGGGASYCGAR